MGEIEVVTARLPGGVQGLLAELGDAQVIIVDERLSPEQREAVIMHERVHVERCGSGWHPAMPASLRPLVRREEARVDRLTADRLIPREDLAVSVEQLVEADVLVTPALIATMWDTTVEVATIALDQLARRRVAPTVAPTVVSSAL